MRNSAQYRKIREYGKIMRGYAKTVCGRIAADVKEYGMAIAALLLYTAVVNLIFHAFCPLIIFSGIPCPGCGVSRATLCFLTGRWQQAWQLNPMVFPIVLVGAYFGWNRYLMGRKAKGIKAITAVLLVSLIIVYGVRMYMYFPNRVPYVYTEDNLLAHFYSFCRQAINITGK